MEARPLTLRVPSTFHLWMNGLPDNRDEETAFREMLVAYKRHFSIAGKKLNVGSFAVNRGGVRWKNSKGNTDLFARLRLSEEAVSVDELEAVSGRLTRKPITSMVIHVGGQKRQFGKHDSTTYCEQRE